MASKGDRDGAAPPGAAVEPAESGADTYAQLRMILEDSPVTMFLIDTDGHVRFCGGGVIDYIRRGLEEAKRSTLFEVFAAERDPLDLVRRAAAGERIHDVAHVAGRHFDLNLMPIMGPDGHVERVAGLATDISERERMLEELRLRSAEQAAVAGLSRRALASGDPASVWRAAARSLRDILRADAVTITEFGVAGRDAGTGVDRVVEGGGAWVHTAGTVPAGSVSRDVRIGAAGRPVGRISIYRRGGDEAAPGDGDPIRAHELAFVQTVATVLESAALRFRMEAEIRHRSLHDDLTGLPNRASFLEYLGRALADTPPGQVGVVFVDLDGFKAVNDTLGHEGGDALLRSVASRLLLSVRSADVVARLGGDEFAVVCGRVATEEEVLAVADRILANLCTPIHVLDRTIVVTASAGVALSGPGVDDYDGLLRASDLAMYRAKREGPGRRVAYRASMRIDAGTPAATRMTTLAEPRE